MTVALQHVKTKDKLHSKIQSALKVVVDKASYEHSDGQTFFFVSKNADSSAPGDTEALNVSILNVLRDFNSEEKTENIKIKSQKMRNFFLQRSQFASSLR